MRKISQQFIVFPFGHHFSNVTVVSTGLYSCWLSKICFAYADLGLLVAI